MTQLNKENSAQDNQDTPGRSLDCNLVPSAGSGGRRASTRARPSARLRVRPRSVVVVIGSGSGGSRSRERGIIDRDGHGDTNGRSPASSPLR